MTKSIGERIEDMKKLGSVTQRSPCELQCKIYPISDPDFETATEGFRALMRYYSVSTEDMMLIKEALSYMYFHTHTLKVGESDLKNSEVADRVKWQ